MNNKADNYFAIIPHWVLFSDLSAQAIRLYCVLRTYADNKTLESWPSRQTLAKDMKLDSVKTVDRAIKELIDFGAIKVEKRFYNNAQQSNRYILMSVAPQMSLPSDTDVPTQPQESRTNYNHITITKELNNKPDGLQIKNLMQIYFDNFIGELEPGRGQMAGHLQQALKQMSYEQLEPLVKLLAAEGQLVTRNTLIIASQKSKVPVAKATPTPPKFDPSEYDRPDAKPMNAEVRALILQGIGKRTDSPESDSMAVLRGEEAGS